MLSTATFETSLDKQLQAMSAIAIPLIWKDTSELPEETLHEALRTWLALKEGEMALCGSSLPLLIFVSEIDRRLRCSIVLLGPTNGNTQEELRILGTTTHVPQEWLS